MDEKKFFLNEFKKEVNEITKWTLTLGMFVTDKANADARETSKLYSPIQKICPFGKSRSGQPL